MSNDDPRRREGAAKSSAQPGDMAGVIDACTWALQSGHGLKFGQWLAAKQGLRRFRGETAIFYMLYTRRLQERKANGAGPAARPPSRTGTPRGTTAAARLASWRKSCNQ